MASSALALRLRLCAYAGLVPSTYASGGAIYNGKLLKAANKWLRWALIEATWVAVGCSGYFGSLYRHHRARGKKANTSITIVARRMSTILWHLLKERRSFKEDFVAFPGRSSHGLTLRISSAGILGQNGGPGI